jgi:flavorubredoxin
MKRFDIERRALINGQKNQIYPSLIIAKNVLVLVDNWYANFLPLIEKGIKNGYIMKSLKNIIITHYEEDHIGSLYDFKTKISLH